MYIIDLYICVTFCNLYICVTFFLVRISYLFKITTYFVQRFTIIIASLSNSINHKLQNESRYLNIFDHR